MKTLKKVEKVEKNITMFASALNLKEKEREKLERDVAVFLSNKDAQITQLERGKSFLHVKYNAVSSTLLYKNFDEQSDKA